MLRFIFKAKNRIYKLIDIQFKKLQIVEWKALYKNRFYLKSGFDFGNLFSLNFDISNSLVQIGNSVTFRDYCIIRSGCDSKLSIGNNVFFNSNCSINCFDEITIGNDCLFGEAVKFYDANHNYKNADVLISSQGWNTGKIKIGNNCWFGANVIILKNVSIGNNVVIGANCLVYKSIPDDCVVTCNQQLKIDVKNKTNIGNG
ncbi:MAG: acyltransferase [Ferruginibacter sp.]|nr:acyltransferase [Ferruginibacter sp.]